MITRKNLEKDPILQFLKWFDEAVHAGIKNPDAMTLATVNRSGSPSARVVLFKGMSGNGFRFFSNYRSRKGKELKANPRAALVFYWAALDKQVRIEGRVEVLTSKESDEYWRSRPLESRFSAYVSPQSSAIPGKNLLEKKIRKLILKGEEIARPLQWGGYRLIPNRIEFWIAGESRFHDRFCYVKKGKKWKISQLAP